MLVPPANSCPLFQISFRHSLHSSSHLYKYLKPARQTKHNKSRNKATPTEANVYPSWGMKYSTPLSWQPILSLSLRWDLMTLDNKDQRTDAPDTSALPPSVMDLSGLP